MTTIQDILDTTSNDFSSLDAVFHRETNCLVLDGKSRYQGDRCESVSIIIPYYKDGYRILYTLNAINQQDLTDSDMGRVQVVLVDDGSDDSLEELLLLQSFRFELTLVIRKENRGRSFTRNEGFEYCQHNIIVCIDSDVLVARNFLREHVVRNLICPSNLFVSLIHNIDELNGQSAELATGRGLSVPDNYAEYRVEENIATEQTGIWKVHEETVIRPLDETRNFRDLGMGRRLAFYDLACMVSSCSFSLTRELWQRIGGFSTEFTGWGLEDTYFGARTIVAGAKVIPVLATGAYHMNHLSRSGSDSVQEGELQHNIAVYEQLINNDI